MLCRVQVLNEVEVDRLDRWRWQAYVGEEAALDVLYQETPDTPSKRCLAKVGCRGPTDGAALLRVGRGCPLISPAIRGAVLSVTGSPPPRTTHARMRPRPPPLQVVKQVAKMLQTSAKGAQPRGEEAQRVLSVFAASLKNPTLVSRPAGWWR